MIIKEIYSKEEANHLKIGFAVALSILAIIFLWLMANNKISHQEKGNYYPILARFNRTDGLLVGDLVRLAGMNVGKVVDAKLDSNFKAVLTLEIKDGINIPDDSSASIVSSGLMGAKYIEIEPGGSEDMIPQGGEFSYTQDAMVVEELLDRIVGIGKAKRSKNKNTTSNQENNNE
ncbi:MAG: outer membrane lipid asymmetry maintenance protein MlaD [Alphaproteobacteria bacterium]|nr:outer membrane lipid asymmetry maintenance protein MlaD [Alphaproteobacteria bacterium]